MGERRMVNRIWSGHRYSRAWSILLVSNISKPTKTIIILQLDFIIKYFSVELQIAIVKNIKWNCHILYEKVRKLNNVCQSVQGISFHKLKLVPNWSPWAMAPNMFVTSTEQLLSPNFNRKWVFARLVQIVEYSRNAYWKMPSNQKRWDNN